MILRLFLNAIGFIAAAAVIGFALFSLVWWTLFHNFHGGFGPFG